MEQRSFDDFTETSRRSYDGGDVVVKFP